MEGHISPDKLLPGRLLLFTLKDAPCSRNGHHGLLKKVRQNFLKTLACHSGTVMDDVTGLPLEFFLVERKDIAIELH